MMNFVSAFLLITAGVTALTASSPAAAQSLRAAPVVAMPAPLDVRLYDPSRIIVKFADGADPAAVMAAAIAGDRESFRSAGIDFAARGGGVTLVDLTAAQPQRESTAGRYATERIGARESTGPLDALVARLNADERVVYAQKNYIMQAFQADAINTIIDGERPGGTATATAAAAPDPDRMVPAGPNDPFLEFQWHLKQHGAEITKTTAPGGVNFPDAWAKHEAQRNIVLAIVDTGQIFDHMDVDEALLLPGYDMISDPFRANDGDGRDDDPTDPGDGTAANDCFPGSEEDSDSWHGSHVSGIAGLAATDNEVGIASGAPSGVLILPVRALGLCGGSSVDLADGLRWAAGLDVPGVPINPNPATIINASFGGQSDGCRPVYEDAIKDVLATGAIVVAAAGNAAIDSKNISPAGCDGVFTVAASDMVGALTSYSNFGAPVDILAPGGDSRADLDADTFNDGILSIFGDSYEFLSGTSMAAPLVAATLALAMANNPDWTAEDAMDRMVATAMPRSGELCAEACGAGLMDAAAMLD